MRFVTEQNRERSLTSGSLYNYRERQFPISTINELDSILESYSAVAKKTLKAREEGVRKNGTSGREERNYGYIEYGKGQGQ